MSSRLARFCLGSNSPPAPTMAGMGQERELAGIHHFRGRRAATNHGSCRQIADKPHKEAEMPAPEELENLLGTMAAVEPQPLPGESDEDENGAVAWYVAYTTYRA